MSGHVRPAGSAIRSAHSLLKVQAADNSKSYPFSRDAAHSTWAEENQESKHSKDDHDDRHDVGTMFLTGRAQVLFEIACN